MNFGERHDAHSTERWQLSAGGTRYQPQHPLHLHVPGFWDEVRIGRRKYSKLLCASFVLDNSGGAAIPGREQMAGKNPRPTGLIELDPYLSYWYWYPNRIEARYYLVRREGIGYKQQAGVRVFLDEKRYIAEDGSLHCELSFDLLKEHPTRLQVVAWGVEAKLRSPDGLAPTSRGGAAVGEAVVPKLSITPFFGMLEKGKLSHRRTGGRYSLRALHWKVDLSAEHPVVLHVTSSPV